MKVYHVRRDPSYISFESKLYDGSTELTQFQADPIEHFNALDCKLKDASKKVGNFAHISDSALLLDHKANDILCPIFDSAGEIHPLATHELGQWFLLNVIESSNPLNKSLSVIDPSDWRKTLEQNKLVFHENRIQAYSTLFKIPDLAYNPILTVSGRDRDELEFYTMYNESNLTGLIFDEIWSSS